MSGVISDWTLLFFSSTGRLARLPFLIGMGVIFFGLFLFDNALPQALRGIVGFIVYPFLLFCASCLLSRRLHDRGHSGWWAALLLLAFALIWPRPNGLHSLFLFPIIWGVVELALLSGEEGTNRYGPNSLKKL